MSVRYVTRAIDEKSVTGNDRLVLIALADHADDDGVCFPGQEKLALRLGVSERTLNRVMSRLEEAGLIERSRRYREFDGFRTSDLYQLFPDSPDKVAGEVTRQSEQGYPTTVSVTKEPSVRTTSKTKSALSPLPSTWVPTAAHIAKAKERGLNLTEEAEVFRFHADATDRRMANWNSAFSMWLTKARPPQAARATTQRAGWQEPARKIHDPRVDGPVNPYRNEV